MALKKQIHCVCDLKYHLVLVTKYRKPVLENKEIADRLKDECRRLIDRYDGEVVEMETDKDHIHLLIAMGPGCSIREIVNVLKGTTSYLLRRDYMDELKKHLYGDSFWSNSYYCSTCGGTTIETIRKYIESQPTKKRKPGNPNLQKKVALSHPTPTGRYESSAWIFDKSGILRKDKGDSYGRKFE